MTYDDQKSNDEPKPKETEKIEGPTPPQHDGAFVWRFDNDDDPTTFYLEIPIARVAADPSINGIIFLLGFFENCKAEAVAQVKRKRARMLQSKNEGIIIPGVNLKVH